MLIFRCFREHFQNFGAKKWQFALKNSCLSKFLEPKFYTTWSFIMFVMPLDQLYAPTQAQTTQKEALKDHFLIKN